MIEKINSSNFDEIIKNDYVFVDFYADWCGPCKMIGKVIEEIANEKENIKFVKINVDESSDIVARFNIMNIPTIMIFKKGEFIKKNVGFLSKSELLEFLEK